MSRTDKDRPYEVKLNDLRAKGKVRKVTVVAGHNGKKRTASHADRALSKVFLKGDLEGIKAHRELLATVDAEVVETEFKQEVVELHCRAEENPHQHDGELFQRKATLWDRKHIAHDLFPDFSYGSTHPTCCIPVGKGRRACVQFMVYRNYTPSANAAEYDDYDSNAIAWPSPPKDRNVSSTRRAKARNSLGTLLRSTDIEDDWDDSTGLDGPELPPFRW